MGRKTLTRAVESLQKQSVQDWRAIVVFDNSYNINYETTDSRIKVMKSDVTNHAGMVRNYALDHVDTDWIAFLDDDDWVKESYVQKLRGYVLAQPHLDLIVFSYQDSTNGRVVPHERQNKIEECKVGISFAVKTSLIRLNHIKFTENAIEDFRFLDACVKAGANYLIPHDIQYMVGGIGGWVRKDD